MSTIKVAYLKLNLQYRVLEHNKHFAKLFNYEFGNMPDLTFTVLFGLSLQGNSQIEKLQIGEQEAYTILRNRRSGQCAENTVVVLYALVKRYENYFTVKIVNWLNWLHGIDYSLEGGYACVNEIKFVTSKLFNKLSIAAGFKSLYPLIAHVPQKFNGGIFPSAIAEIMQLFALKPKADHYSRDYARNIYSRIKTNLKQEYNQEYVDVIDLIHDNELLNIILEDEVSILNTELTKNLMLRNNHSDILLDSIIDIMPINL
ncbi:MAG: hypothetical protein KBD37_02800 [Burkholderiales bacterium]|nr:hypothetical protein [Burkholderiales bacterium]